MTRWTNVCSWLLVLCSVACGGNTVGTKPEPEPTSKPQPGSAGTGTAQQSPGQAGTSSTEPEPQPEPTCQDPQPVCVPSCASLERAFSECVDGQYRCPNGWVDLDSCSKEACARRSRNCCAPTGASEYPECTPEGNIAECPAGFEPASPCLPAGFDIESCDDLADGTACTSEQQICLKDRCGRNCRCEPDLDGKLQWRCRVNAC